MRKDVKKDEEIYFSRFSQETLRLDSKTFTFSKGTPAEEFCVDLLRRYPTLFNSRHVVLDHVFLSIGTGIEWNSKGRMVQTLRGDNRPELSLNTARQLMVHNGGPWIRFSTFATSGPLFNIPDNVSEDWLILAMRFLQDIVEADPKAFEWGARNFFAEKSLVSWRKSTTFQDEVKRACQDFKKLQATARAYIKAQGWKFLLPARMTKKRKTAMADMYEQILKKLKI